MNKTKNLKPPRNYVGYFTLCQTIGGEIEDSGRLIGKLSTIVPASKEMILEELNRMTKLCEVAKEAIQQVHEQWTKL